MKTLLSYTAEIDRAAPLAYSYKNRERLRCLVRPRFVFTGVPVLRQLWCVRQLLTLSLLMIFAAPLFGQEQERKLVDRLLKPDMSLQSTEQNTKFLADKTLVDKHASVSAFYLQKNSKPKGFRGTGGFSTASFTEPLTSPAQAKAPNISSRTILTTSTYTTRSMRVNSVHDAGKTRNTKDFAGNRPFLEEGKSQKSLSRKNTPLTIEQVRELLNKNK
jgi:hypothetical protein